MTTKFIDAVEAGDAVAFQEYFGERMSDKVAMALDACQVEVAKKFFNLKDEEATAEGEEVVEEGNKPLDRLKHHVTGAIERGEKKAIEGEYEADGTKRAADNIISRADARVTKKLK